MPADVGSCYDTHNLGVPPGSLGPYFASLVKGGHLLKNSSGYRLQSTATRRSRRSTARTQPPYTSRPCSPTCRQSCRRSPSAHTLDEALTCFKAGSARAPIVMTWNLVYAHLCDHIVKNKLTEFNAQWLTANPGDHKKGPRTIRRRFRGRGTRRGQGPQACARLWRDRQERLQRPRTRAETPQRRRPREQRRPDAAADPGLHRGPRQQRRPEDCLVSRGAPAPSFVRSGSSTSDAT